MNYPDKYLSFLTGVLFKEDHLLWFPREEAREVFLALTETECQQKQLENLRKIYLTEEELDLFLYGLYREIQQLLIQLP